MNPRNPTAIVLACASILALGGGCDASRNAWGWLAKNVESKSSLSREKALGKLREARIATEIVAPQLFIPERFLEMANNEEANATGAVQLRPVPIWDTGFDGFVFTRMAYQRLKEQGYVRWTDISQQLPFHNGNLDAMAIELTARGEQFLGTGRAIKVPLFTLSPSEVTGITVMNDNHSALVEFVTGCTNFTPAAEALSITEKDCPRRQRHIAFTLFDDGWRVTP